MKKGKLKTNKLSKITILDEQEPSVKSAYRAKTVQVGGWENMLSPKTGSIAATKVESPGAKWVAFRLFSKLDRCHSWKLLRCITSSYILLIYIICEASKKTRYTYNWK